jgi:hypothetical protein
MPSAALKKGGQGFSDHGQMSNENNGTAVEITKNVDDVRFSTIGSQAHILNAISHERFGNNRCRLNGAPIWTVNDEG